MATDGSSFPDFGSGGSIAGNERLRFGVVHYPAHSGGQAPVTATVTGAKVCGLGWET